MSDDYKYFAFKEGPNWRVNDLLPVSQIRKMLATLEWKREVFASIQTYDEHANIISCPLFFDLDGQGDHVHAEARAFCQATEFILNVTPRIYFSGNKGFHLIIEKPVVHPRCHELVADFAAEVAGSLRTVDKKVYTSRRMFRIPGSPASKRGFYKTEITRTELFNLSFDQIRELARNQRFIETEHDPSKMDEDVYASWLAIAIAKLPRYDNLGRSPTSSTSVDLEMTPCIATMMTAPPPVGERNSVVYILARFFKTCDVDEASFISVLLQYPHWKAYESEHKEITKVARSVYRGGRPTFIGCRGDTQHAVLMRSYCMAPCHFRTDFDHNPFAKETP